MVRTGWEAPLETPVSQEVECGEGEPLPGFSGHMMFKRCNHVPGKESECEGPEAGPWSPQSPKISAHFMNHLSSFYDNNKNE